MSKEHLKHFLPFLREEFRVITFEETTSEEVFKELFPNEKTDLSKLDAIYQYQKADAIKVTVTETPNDITVEYKWENPVKKRVKRNGKV
jgi:hypothetical protein